MSRAPSSTHRPFSGLYTWVPLMMTVWAGRLTPHASVDVDTSTWMCRSAKRSSISVRSTLKEDNWKEVKKNQKKSYPTRQTHCRPPAFPQLSHDEYKEHTVRAAMTTHCHTITRVVKLVPVDIPSGSPHSWARRGKVVHYAKVFKTTESSFFSHPSVRIQCKLFFNKF